LVRQAGETEGSDPKAAESLYRKAIAADGGHEAARVGLARVLLTREGTDDEAEELLKPVEGGPFAEEAERRRAGSELRKAPHDDSELVVIEGLAENQPDNAPVQLKYGHALAARGDYEGALAAMLRAAEADKGFARGPAKESMVALFKVIGIRSQL